MTAVLHRAAGAPSRDPPASADAAAVLALPRSQRAAAVEVVSDLARNARPVDAIDRGRRCAAIERCARYYTPSGTMSEGVAEVVFPQVLALVGAREISAREAEAVGFPVRRAGRRGRHYLLPDPSRPAELLAALDRLGLRREVSISSCTWGDPVQVATVTRGRATWTTCPCHDDRDPSCQINDSGLAYCYACARVVGRAVRTSADTASFSILLRREGPPPAPRLVPTTGVHDCPGTGSASDLPYSTVMACAAGSPGTLRPAGGSPTGARVLDAAGLVLGESTPMARGLVLGRRFGDGPRQRAGRFARSYSSKRDLLDLLRSAQRRDAGPGARGRALEAEAAHERSGLADHRHFLPDRYVGLDEQAHRSVRSFARSTATRDVEVLVPDDFGPVATRWVGVDLDGFERAPVGDAALVLAAREIERAAEASPFFSGRVGVVRTSHLGVQVVLELARTRLDPEAFYQDRHVRAVLEATDALCLRAVRDAGFEGGHADPTVHAPGRYVRRPGPRKTKQGTAFVSRLAYASP